jgi:hypothetical protein
MISSKILPKVLLEIIADYAYQVEFKYFHFLDKKPVKKTLWAKKDDHEMIRWLVQNPQYINEHKFLLNDLAVEWLIRHPHRIRKYFFSKNANDMAIKWFIQSSEHIPNDYYFSWNKNDMAVELLIRNVSSIKLCYFSKNENDLAVEWLIQNPQMIDKDSFCQNNNDLAFQYVIQHNMKPFHLYPPYFYCTYCTNKRKILKTLST